MERWRCCNLRWLRCWSRLYRERQPRSWTDQVVVHPTTQTSGFWVLTTQPARGNWVRPGTPDEDENFAGTDELDSRSLLRWCYIHIRPGHDLPWFRTLHRPRSWCRTTWTQQASCSVHKLTSNLRIGCEFKGRGRQLPLLLFCPLFRHPERRRGIRPGLYLVRSFYFDPANAGLADDNGGTGIPVCARDDEIEEMCKSFLYERHL
jgi:hypothetical protein